MEKPEKYRFWMKNNPDKFENPKSSISYLGGYHHSFELIEVISNFTLLTFREL